MLTRLALARPLRLAPALARPVHVSAPRFVPAGDGGPSTKTPDPSNGPQTTQGHTTTKSHGLDVQNDNANAGQAARDGAGAGSSAGQGQGPIDAARMTGGEAKPDAEGTGAFKDQVGGQDRGGGVQKGGKTEVPKEGWMGKIGNALSGNKAFHTSARSSAGARDPVESNLAGEQNEHLKHKKPSEGDSGKGNAAPEPHLPSHQNHSGDGARGDGAQSQTAEQTAKNPAQAGKASGAPKGFAAFHSSARSAGQNERDGPGYAAAHEPEAKKAGYNAPPEALPPNLESNYNRAEATPPPQPNMTPSSEAAYSSSAVDPPNEALRKQVKDGTLPASNPQPTAEGGRQGLGEAWKNRK